MEHDNSLLDDRIVDQKRSQSAKLGWKKHHNHYRQGMKKRSRSMDKGLYQHRHLKDIIGDLREALNEAELERENPFSLENDLRFQSLPGGIATRVDRDNNTFSLTLVLDEKGGQGNYRLLTEIADKDTGYDILNQNIKEDLKVAMDTFDQSIKQIMQKYGLASTF